MFVLNIDLCTSWSDIRYVGHIAGVVRARITRSAVVLKNNPVVLLLAFHFVFIGSFSGFQTQGLYEYNRI